MDRFGPLHAYKGFLRIGDPTRRHLRLDQTGVRAGTDAENRDPIAWESITSIRVELPQTWFRYPGALAGIAMSAVALATQETPEFDVKTGEAVVVTPEATAAFIVDSHHLIGYFSGAIRTANRLLERLIVDEPSRTLLDVPEALVQTAASAVRLFR